MLLDLAASNTTKESESIVELLLNFRKDSNDRVKAMHEIAMTECLQQQERVKEEPGTSTPLLSVDDHDTALKYVAEKAQASGAPNQPWWPVRPSSGDLEFAFGRFYVEHKMDVQDCINLLQAYRPFWEDSQQDSPGFSSALALAAKCGNTGATKALIQFGVAFGGDKVGWNPCHFAANCGHVAVLQLLLDADADAGVLSKSGEDALAMAAREGHIHVVKALLAAGAKIVRLPGSATGERSHSGGSTALHGASESCHALCVKELLEADDALIDSTESSLGLTPLSIASLKGSDQTVRVLLEAGANKEARSSPCHRTAIHFAAEGGHLAVVQELLEFGAEHDTKSFIGTTPLYFACQGGYLDVVSVLCQAGADVNAAADGGESPLMAACQVMFSKLLFQLHRNNIGHCRCCCRMETLMWSNICFQLVHCAITRAQEVQRLFCLLHRTVRELLPSKRTLDAVGDARHRAGYMEMTQELLSAGADIGPAEIGHTPLGMRKHKPCP